MRIGIDIDGVITNLTQAMVDYGTKFCYENSIDYKIDLTKYDEKDFWGISYENVEKFWNEYLEKYATQYPTRMYASEVISKLKQKNQIYIITARNEQGLPKETYGTMQKMVKNWLAKNNISYDKIIFTGEDKQEACVSNKIDVMIEDSPKNIKRISEKVKVICFNNQYNENINQKNVIRAYSWYDVLKKVEKIG